ncbi:hypothetical protein B0H13DRAFT_1906624 [Mycena leptocephala]|nr:hypothetical protein B0H13DRAFT_1906624 [Mycena leptocephala]
MNPAFSSGNPFYNHAMSDPSGLAQRLQRPAALAVHHLRGPRQLPVPPVPHLYAGQYTIPPMRAMPQHHPVQHPYYTPTVSSGPSHQYVPYHQYPHPNAMGASVSGHVAAIGPIPKVFSLSVGGWLESDRLSLERNNWIPWATRVKLELGLQPGAVRFLGGDNPCPSFDMFPGHHRAWLDTDAVVRAFISNVCAVTERECFADETTALAVWNTLRQRHEHRGPIGQISSLRKFVVTKYSNDPSTFSATTTELSNLNSSIWAAGPVDANSFLLAGMLAALSTHHQSIWLG